MTTPTKRILIHQVKEWGEIITGFEGRNRYELFDEHGALIGRAAEEAGGLGRFFGRQLLGHCRRSTLRVLTPDGRETLRGEKPFRFYFHRMDAYEGTRLVGAIERRFSLLHRKFVILNAAGDEVLEVHSPLFRIWTFEIRFRGEKVGVIRKRWGGVLRELFTDADAFGIEYPDTEAMEALRPVLICGTFLIDFTCFENNQGNGGFAFGGD